MTWTDKIQPDLKSYLDKFSPDEWELLGKQFAEQLEQ